MLPCRNLRSNGVQIPRLGLGTWFIPDVQAAEVVRKAVETGYRLIDTASAYFNEEAVGAAVKKSGIPRAELFITTKFWIQDAGYGNAKKAHSRLPLTNLVLTIWMLVLY